MWIRQCELPDNELPITPRIASNEEFVPPPQTAEQRAYQQRALELADQNARKLGLGRRAFLRSGAGMATALLALNHVFGECYAVEAVEAEDPKAFEEKWPKEQFIFDIQTHHVDVSRKWYDHSEYGQRVARFFQMLRKGRTLEDSLEQLNRAHYVKEIFGDSDTVMAVISGVPSRDWDKNPLPPDQMVATRKFVNDLAGSRRVLSHGLLRPNLGAKELDEMERQVQTLKIDAWKTYTGAELGEKAWFLDDEKVAYPFWERTQKLGIKNVCVHKGLPLGAFNEKGCTPFDLEKAAKDWPGLNFIVYHSGFRGFGWAGAGTGDKIPYPQHPDAQELPWVSDILRILKKNPKLTNIYFELGSTFNTLSAIAPKVCLHMLGQMLQVAGPDRILWGTDSIWNGSPQSQIVRLRRLQMTDDLKERYQYPDLTDEVKNKILGLNAARLFGIDPKSMLKSIKTDKLTQLREQFRGEPDPSQTQYGWIWIGDQAPTVPVGTANDERPGHAGQSPE